MSKEKLSRSKDLAARVVYAALQILKEKGGQAPRKELIEEVPNRVELDDWARTVYEKTGYLRWQSTLSFFSIDYIKAGFLLKNKGLWYLTPEGEKALELGPPDMLRAAQAAYYKWKAQKDANTDPEVEAADEEDAEGPPQQNPTATLDQTQELASTGLKDQINLRNAYEFQDLVAALLRGMGYYTPFVAPKGKDGGIDVIAYRDPLGTISPRIKIQIKHRDSTASVQEVRELMGLLQKDGDVGMFVSTGGFTADAKSTARGSHVHVELVDFDRFIGLWQEFYLKLKDEDKALLPLVPIYFYAPPS
jgi:restriction system protein